MKTLTVTLLALLATSSATAYYNNDTCYPCNPCPQDLYCPCPQDCYNPCQQNCNIPCQQDCSQSCDPCNTLSCCDLGAEFWAEWLVWRVRKCNLDFAVPFDESSDRVIGNVYDITLDWNSGGRWALFGTCNEMQFGAKYSRFSLDDHGNVTRDDGNLAATRVGEDNQFTTNGSIQFAYGKYLHSFDVVDAEAAYVPETCNNYGMRLFGGFRYAHIYQEYRSRYSSNASDRSGTTVNPATGLYISNFDGIEQKVNMFGYGLYFGGSGYKDVYCGFGLFGKASLGAMIGSFHRKYKHQGHNVGDNVFTIETNLKDDCNRLVSILDLSAGFQYRIEGSCGRIFTLKVGYAFENWFNTPDFMMVFGGEDIAFDRHIESIGYDGMFLKLEASF